jgi:hypothetical protein
VDAWPFVMRVVCIFGPFIKKRHIKSGIGRSRFRFDKRLAGICRGSDGVKSMVGTKVLSTSKEFPQINWDTSEEQDRELRNL